MEPLTFELAYTPLDGIPHASECEHLIVGQTYLVPCVNGAPVIGEPHTDNDHFNRTPGHWHIDSRFDADSCGGHPQTCAVATGIAQTASQPYTPPKQVSIEPRVCLRASPKSWDAEDQGQGVGMTMASLIAHYATSRAICGRCPHKGMPIQDGICTGHRLEWNADGTSKYKPPFTLRIRGSENSVALAAGVEHDLISIPIVKDYEGPTISLELLDGDGHVVIAATPPIQAGVLRAGDMYKLCFTPREGRSRAGRQHLRGT